MTNSQAEGVHRLRAAGPHVQKLHVGSRFLRKMQSMKASESFAASVFSVNSEKALLHGGNCEVVKFSLEKCSVDWVVFIMFAVKFAVLLICASMRVLMFTSAEAVGGVGGSGISPLECLRVRWNEMATHVDPCLAAVFHTGPTECLCRQTPKRLNNYITVGGEGMMGRRGGVPLPI